jgi:hypothetical protein
LCSSATLSVPARRQSVDLFAHSAGLVVAPDLFVIDASDPGRRTFRRVLR